MLRYLRENTGNWIIKIFLGIIVVVFIFLGVGSIGSKKNNSVASVNDESISIKAYQQAYKNRIQQLQARFGKNLNEDLIKAFNVKQMVLDQLIEEKLLLNEAEKLEIRVSDKEIQDWVMSIKAFQKDGVFDLKTYNSVLNRNSLTPEQFEQNQILALKEQKLQNMITSSVNVSDIEAEAFYLFNNSKRAVHYLHFSPGRYKDIKPTEEQIKTYYDEHKNNYMSEAKRKAAFIKFSPKDYKDQVSISDKAAKDYYDQNTSQFQTPEKVEARHILVKLDPKADEIAVAAAEKKAEEIYQKAVGGENFEKLAKEFSEGPSKSSGGYLGTFEHKNMVKPFADAAFAMKAGEISKPVRTQFGLHIIKLMARFEADMKTFDEVSDKIKTQLTKENLGYIAYDKAGEAFDAVIDGDDFEQVAMIAKKKIKTTDAFDINGKGLAFSDAKQFAQAAFSLDDDISDVKQFGDAYYLIKITEQIEPAVQELSLVQTKVKKDVIKKTQKDLALKDATDALEKARQGSSLSSIPVPDGIQVKKSAYFSRDGKIKGISDASKIVDAAFSLTDQNKAYPEIIETADGYYIISYENQKQPDAGEISDNLKTVKEELTRKKQRQAYQAWMSQLKEKSSLKVNPNFIN